MFGKLKEKLKSALSSFSKKAEEEIVEDEAVSQDLSKEEVKMEPLSLDDKNLKSEKKFDQFEAKPEDESKKVDEKTEPIEKEKIAAPLPAEQPEPENNNLEDKPAIKNKEVYEEVSSIPSAEDLIEQTKKHFADEKPAQRKQKPAQEILNEVKEQEPPKKTAFSLDDKDSADKKERNLQLKDEPEELVALDTPSKKSGFFSKFKRKFSKDKKTDTSKEKLKEKDEAKSVEEKKSILGKVKKSLTTKTISEQRFSELFWELEVALLENNVSVEVIEKIKEDLKLELVDKPLPRDVGAKIEQTLKKTLTNILSMPGIDLLEKSRTKKPLVIALFGVNGAGKTTTIAKLTQYFLQNEKKVILAACDTFRAAAIQQLEEHAKKLGVKIIKQDYESDAAAVAYDAVKYAGRQNIDVVLIDTAGRLHSNTNLMGELEKIIRVVNPDVKIFVGESITGNDCIEQAAKFNESVEMDGVILTKADVDDKGGAPLSISYTIKKPILFLGMGQDYGDLEEFSAQKIIERLGL